MQSTPEDPDETERIEVEKMLDGAVDPLEGYGHCTMLYVDGRLVENISDLEDSSDLTD